MQKRNLVLIAVLVLGVIIMVGSVANNSASTTGNSIRSWFLNFRDDGKENTPDQQFGISPPLTGIRTPVYVYMPENDQSTLIYGLCSDLECRNMVDEYTLNNAYYAHSIKIGSDNLPLLLGSFPTNNDLILRKCFTKDCVNGQNIIILEEGSVTDYQTLQIGSDGLPIVVYFSYFYTPVFKSRVMLYKCLDLDCNSGYKVIVDEQDSPETDTGDWFNVEIKPDGFPIFAVAQNHPTLYPKVKIISCLNLDCNQTSVTIVPESSFVVATQIAIGSDRLPIVAYQNYLTGELSLVRCLDSNCLRYNPPVLIDYDGTDPTIIITDDGLPALVYRRWTSNNDAYYAKCYDLGCTNKFSKKVFSGYNSNGSPDMIKGQDGFPIITIGGDMIPYIDKIVTLKCRDIKCQIIDEFVHSDHIDPSMLKLDF